jgi:uncharacterized protein YbjT (DUF2867 family)
MILVVGATGELGGEVCRRLRQQDRPVRALVRPGSPKESALAELGAEVVHGNLTDPESLRTACRGAQAVVTTANAIKARRRADSLKAIDRDGNLALVEAARAEGVRRFVFTSLTPHLPENNPFVRYKRQVERAVRESGLAWTVLQPSAFMETSFSPMLGWDAEQGKVRVVGPGTAPISYISEKDVAEFTALVVEDSRAEGRDFPLGGPEALSPLAAVRIFEEVFGRPFQVRHLPAWVLHAVRLAARPVSPWLASVCGLALGGVKSDVIDMMATLREFPLPLTSVRDYARAQRSDFSRDDGPPARLR